MGVHKLVYQHYKKNKKILLMGKTIYFQVFGLICFSLSFVEKIYFSFYIHLKDTAANTTH